MERRDSIRTGVEHERLAVEDLVALDLADRDHVVAGVELAHVAADEMRERPVEQRHATDPLGGRHTRELVLGGVVANCRDRWCCPAESTFTAKWVQALKAAQCGADSQTLRNFFEY